ncbi:uncharacterized protein ACLA_097100 [Aspergillus clavatus NRRL 1]|uniref:Uncharacterized protein n=1 Tax=Aspergillus clavatus (strain ATCC 1007 / CBS 513.65 / DSM 816 / NCTC 3887 / NRRL 1 / QM 1276 / 107) TaxID=344612 RepID=A1CMI7_ASPCL|nr:uncharacterized protein ACLA_097100 [Aspergillus clavatus NRRL 1]EAW08774.1 conserved hypothetical protein [Aspergillus clavatus NRRL 1]
MIPRQQRILVSPRLFSLQSSIRNSQRVDPKGQSNDPSSENPEYPRFSLDSLGLSKTTKTVVIVVLGVFGTIESWFWCQTIWRWWKGGSEEK